MILVLALLGVHEKALGSPTATDQSDQVSFKVTDIKRPVTRGGRTLISSPRDIYLEASRSPTSAEARPLSKSEKRALKRRFRRSSLDTWQGRILRVYRLGPEEMKEFPTEAHQRYFSQLRDYEAQLIAERDAKLAALSETGSPIALSTPKADPSLLETSDDDDELSGSEEGEICGHLGEPCCQTTRRGSCDTKLMCVEGSCVYPPDPCGGFEQSCCDQGARCLRGGQVCDESSLTCIVPPPPPERLKIPVGVIEIVAVYDNNIVKARVRFDALKPQRKSKPLNAIRVGDEATWY